MRARGWLLIGPALVAIAGCGGDTTTVERTVTRTVERPATTPAPRECPDFTTTGGRVSAVRTTVGCDAVRALASDVLSRDDCVEESPSGVNACTAQGFACETRIEGRARFVVTCRRGADEVRFQAAAA